MDLNADLGEGVTDDAALLEIVTSANVACGFHAGDESVMAQVCEIAVERGVRIGAQVSYADREGFGRRHTDVADDVLTGWVAEQIGVLSSVAERYGGTVSYVKPHGALYNRVVEDPAQAAAVLAGSGDLPVFGLPNSQILRLARELGLIVVPEGFADRGYTADGRLIPRDQPGALIAEAEAIGEHAVALARSGTVETICVHGDSPGAVSAAAEVRRRLLASGFELAKL